MITSRKMKWVGHAVSKGYMKSAHKSLVGYPKGKRPFRDLGIDGKISLK